MDPRTLIGDPHRWRIVADRVHDPASEIRGGVEDVIRLVAIGLARRPEAPEAESGRDHQDDGWNDDAGRDRGTLHGAMIPWPRRRFSQAVRVRLKWRAVPSDTRSGEGVAGRPLRGCRTRFPVSAFQPPQACPPICRRLSDGQRRWQATPMMRAIYRMKRRASGNAKRGRLQHGRDGHGHLHLRAGDRRSRPGHERRARTSRGRTATDRSRPTWRRRRWTPPAAPSSPTFLWASSPPRNPSTVCPTRSSAKRSGRTRTRRPAPVRRRPDRRWHTCRSSSGCRGKGCAAFHPATTSTVITPPVGTYDPFTGHIGVMVRDAAGVPQENTSVSISGPGVSESQTTSVDGCAFFAFEPIGAYTVTLNRAGYVSDQLLDGADAVGDGGSRIHRLAPVPVRPGGDDEPHARRRRGRRDPERHRGHALEHPPAARREEDVHERRRRARRRRCPASSRTWTATRCSPAAAWPPTRRG